MRFAAILLPALVHAGVLERAGCNANNCARAVTGTRDKEPNVATRQAQCSSFQLITVTPDPTTSTITIVSPQTVTATEHTTTTMIVSKPVATKTETIWAKRAITVSPSVIPAYATACSSPAAYASACSCWGITQSTTQAPTPTVYVTITVSPTVTNTATVTDSVTNTVSYTASATVSGDAQCKGATTGCRPGFPLCPAGSPYTYCLCGDNPDGTKHCFGIANAADFCNNHAPCRSSADCAAGNTCIAGTSTCCTFNGDWEPARCWPTAKGFCPNAAAAARRMLRGERALEVEVMPREQEHISPFYEGGPIAGGD